MTQTTVTKTLEVLRELFAAYNIPEHLVTDNGPQFTADEFVVFTKRNGIKHVKTALYISPCLKWLGRAFYAVPKTTYK